MTSDIIYNTNYYKSYFVIALPVHANKSFLAFIRTFFVADSGSCSPLSSVAVCANVSSICGRENCNTVEPRCLELEGTTQKYLSYPRFDLSKIDYDVCCFIDKGSDVCFHHV